MTRPLDYNSLILFGSTVLSFELDLLIKFLLAASTLLYNIVRFAEWFKNRKK